MRKTRYLGAPLQSNYWTGDKLVIPGATYQGASIQPWGSGGMFDPNNLPAPLPPGENPQGDVQDQGGQSGGGLGATLLGAGPTILGAANKAYGLFSEGGQTAVEAGAEYLKGTELYRDMFGPDTASLPGSRPPAPPAPSTNLAGAFPSSGLSVPATNAGYQLIPKSANLGTLGNDATNAAYQLTPEGANLGTLDSMPLDAPIPQPDIPSSDPLSNLPQDVPYDAVAPDIFGSPSLGGNAAGNALSYAGNVQAAGAAPSLAPGLPFSGPGAPSLFGAGTAAPLNTAGQAVNLNVPAEAWNPTTGEFNFVQAGEPATGQFTTAAGLSNIQGGAGLSTGLPSSAAEIAAGQAAEFGAGGFFGSGTAAANAAALGYGGIPITAAPAALEGAGLLGSGQLAAGAGAAGAALGGGAGIAGLGFGGGASGAIGAQAAAAATPALGGLAALGPAAMIALPFIARALLDKPTDPTINARLTQQFEGTAQAKGIEGMEKAIYANPNLYDLGRIATSGRTGGHGRVQLAPPGTKPTNGGTAVIPWSSELSDLFNKNIDSLQAASHAGQLNTSGVGMDGPDKYHPIYKPDPNIYEMVAGEYDIMERRLVGGPAYEDSLTYAEGGTVNAQPEAPEQGAGPNPLVMGAIEAIMGQHPEPEKAIDAFIQVYGKAAFAELRKGVIAEGSKGEREQAGLGAVPAQGGGIAGPGTDTSDSIPGQITQGGQPVENIKVADGEYILPKKMVDGMGGEAALDEAREQFI